MTVMYSVRVKSFFARKFATDCPALGLRRAVGGTNLFFGLTFKQEINIGQSKWLLK
jgi:hypothetical protein